MISVLRIVSGVIFVCMVYVVITTSQQSNLFTLIQTWESSNPMAAWFSATLWDFYANVTFLFVWIAYKENHIGKSLLWLVLLVCLGSIATALYFLIQLFRLKPGEGLDKLFVRRGV